MHSHEPGSTEWLRLLGAVLLSAVSAVSNVLTQPPIVETIPGPYLQPSSRPEVSLPTPPIRVSITPLPPHAVRNSTGDASVYHRDREVSWYGPGFYGRRTACGFALTKSIQGVAHRSLPCGTKVQFRWKGRVITVPVIDRGPYVQGRIWDLTGGACVALAHCFTGPIEWRIIK